jgi:anti-sigma regulatory factor (Ser/Thr protein kinase)
MGEYAMATAAYAVFDPETGRLRLATAGHLPPMLLAGAASRLIEVTPGAPLGGFPYGSCPETELSLVAGEIIMLFTDGLVERRGVALSDSMDELLGIASEARSAEGACMLALDALVPPDGLDDDAAILALQSTSVPSELRLELAADPQELSRIRRVVRRWLRTRGASDGAVAEITLAVNEACANAIEHAYSPGAATFELSASTSGDQVVIAVCDAGQWRAPRGEDRGRGLTIIETAMDEVEVNSTPEGTEIVMRRSLVMR